MAQWGEDVNAIRWLRTFTTHERAIEHLKQKCKEYAAREDVDFLVTKREEGAMIVPARGPLPQRRM